MSKHIASLGLGSNLGDRENHLKEGCAQLSRYGRLHSASSVFATAPVGLLNQPEFLNQVIQIETIVDPFALLRGCAAIEAALGRERRIPMGPRTIDIDLLLFDDEIIRGTREGLELIVPHPRLHLRRFVLEPLASIAPELVHPLLGKSIAQLLAELDDPSSVNLWRG